MSPIALAPISGSPRPLPEAGPAVWEWDEDQCWTLARIAEVVHRRFGVGYTLAKRNLTQLTTLVKTRLKRMQYRSSLLDGSSPAPAPASHPFRYPSQ